MTGSSLSLLRPNAVRAYIIFTPSSLFSVKYNEAKIHARIAESVTTGRYQAQFADRELTTNSVDAIRNSPRLWAGVEEDLTLLAQGFFGSVWLYGDSTSDFTLAAVNLSLQKKLRLINLAERGSLLDRYLESWIRRFGTLA